MSLPFVIFREVGKIPAIAPGAVLVQGLPGMGLVGRLSVDHLIEVTDAKEVVRIYSSFLPPVVRVEEKGMARLARLEIHVSTKVKPNLFILTGDYQPADIGIVTVLSDVLNYLEKSDIESVVAIGGLRSDIQEDVGAFGYDPKVLEDLNDNGIPLLENHEISGAVGVLTSLASEAGMRSMGLLGKLHLSGTDPIAAKNVLKAFARIFNIEEKKLKLEKLEDQIKAAEAHETAVQDLFEQAEKEGVTKDDKGYYI